MKKNKTASEEPNELRTRAEELLHGQNKPFPDVSTLSQDEIAALVHDLRVYQIELELQNEELRRSQQELEESRDNYSDLYDYAPVGYFTIGQDGLIREVNLSGAVLLGADRESLIGRPFSRFVSEDDWPAFYSCRERVYETEARESCEIKLVRKDGKEFYAQMQSVPVKNAHGQLDGFRTIVLDITERKDAQEELQRTLQSLESRVEERTADLSLSNKKLLEEIAERKLAVEALRLSEERFRTIFENAQDCIFIKDRNLILTHANPAMERLFGSPGSSLVGSRSTDLFGREDVEHVLGVDKRVLGGESIEVEHTFEIKGIPVTLNTVLMPLYGVSGEVVGLFGIARDVTQRKRIVSQGSRAVPKYPSKAMNSALSTALMAARRTSSVLLMGESGSGKDYLAKYIHDHSVQASGPYFSINCAAISRGLAESELFGHERGAFTGAHARKRGLLELAEGGTLLLNEIGELSLGLQSKLLTFLDTKRFTRVGGEKQIMVNARILSATNRELEKEVAAGSFRNDLYYRLNVLTIKVPPLRERREDLPLLVQEIFSRLQDRHQIKELPGIAPAVWKVFENYEWPGNVRELRNVLERALMLSDHDVIGVESLGIHSDCIAEDKWAFATEFPNGRSLNEITRNLKRSLVIEALRRTGGSRTKTADLLGISRYSLKHYISSLGINGEFGED